MLEMREIEAFVAVAEELHFGRAAERLHRSPSNISQAVRALEQRVGGVLFQRTSRTVRLTSVGEQLLAEWRPALRSLSTGLLEARRSIGTANRPLRIGYPASLPENIRITLSQRCPQMGSGRPVVWLREGLNGVYLWNAQSEHDLDVATLWLPPQHSAIGNTYLRTGPQICRSEAALLVSLGHPLAGRVSVDVEELADHCLVNPEVATAIRTEWVPERTPAGRPITRTTVTTRHLDRLYETTLERSAAHLTFRMLSKSPAWESIRGRATLVPVTGLQPFTLRTVWPGIETDGATTKFAQQLASAGRDLNDDSR
ncbi:DNA-binding transcriptional LysR family regulator [Nocardia sp. GAS34]